MCKHGAVFFQSGQPLCPVLQRLVTGYEVGVRWFTIGVGNDDQSIEDLCKAAETDKVKFSIMSN